MLSLWSDAVPCTVRVPMKQLTGLQVGSASAQGVFNVTSPSLAGLAHRTARLHRCTEVLLSALIARKVDSREGLRNAWKDEPKCE